MQSTKSYPKSLHMYEIEYSDNECKILYACGMTHAYAISKECWPNRKVIDVRQLDDSWKN